MAVLSLSEVTNNYGTYRGNSLVGERGAVATVPNDGLNGINGVPYPFLSGIIVKINGSSYTFSGYLNQLKLQGNPYISKSTIPTISFTLDQLVNTPIPDAIVYGNVARTQYSEVTITKKMSTIDDVLSYLNDFFNPNTSDIVLDPLVFGSWDLTTTDYEPDLDVIGEYPGLEFQEYEGLQGVVTPSSPPTVTEPKTPDPEPIVETEPPKPIEVIKPDIQFDEIQIPPIEIPPLDLDFSDIDFGTPKNINLGFGLNSVQTTQTTQTVFQNQGGAAAAAFASQQAGPQKPTFNGNYTGQPGTGPDGSSWVWIPGQGGWTKS